MRNEPYSEKCNCLGITDIDANCSHSFMETPGVHTSFDYCCISLLGISRRGNINSQKKTSSEASSLCQWWYFRSGTYMQYGHIIIVNPDIGHIHARK